MPRDPVTPCRSDLFKTLPPIKWESWQHMNLLGPLPIQTAANGSCLDCITSSLGSAPPSPGVPPHPDLLSALQILCWSLTFGHDKCQSPSQDFLCHCSCQDQACVANEMCCPLPSAATSLVSPNPLFKHSSGAAYIISQADLVSKAPIAGARLSRKPVHF